MERKWEEEGGSGRKWDTAQDPILRDFLLVTRERD